jgi:hypothetical protein
MASPEVYAGIAEKTFDLAFGKQTSTSHLNIDFLNAHGTNVDRYGDYYKSEVREQLYKNWRRDTQAQIAEMVEHAYHNKFWRDNPTPNEKFTGKVYEDPITGLPGWDPVEDNEIGTLSIASMAGYLQSIYPSDGGRSQVKENSWIDSTSLDDERKRVLAEREIAGSLSNAVFTSGNDDPEDGADKEPKSSGIMEEATKAANDALMETAELPQWVRAHINEHYGFQATDAAGETGDYVAPWKASSHGSRGWNSEPTWAIGSFGFSNFVDPREMGVWHAQEFYPGEDGLPSDVPTNHSTGVEWDGVGYSAYLKKIGKEEEDAADRITDRAAAAARSGPAPVNYTYQIIPTVDAAGNTINEMWEFRSDGGSPESTGINVASGVATVESDKKGDLYAVYEDGTRKLLEEGFNFAEIAPSVKWDEEKANTRFNQGLLTDQFNLTEREIDAENLLAREQLGLTEADVRQGWEFETAKFNADNAFRNNVFDEEKGQFNANLAMDAEAQADAARATDMSGTLGLGAQQMQALDQIAGFLSNPADSLAASFALTGDADPSGQVTQADLVNKQIRDYNIGIADPMAGLFNERRDQNERLNSAMAKRNAPAGATYDNSGVPFKNSAADAYSYYKSIYDANVLGQQQHDQAAETARQSAGLNAWNAQSITPGMLGGEYASVAPDIPYGDIDQSLLGGDFQSGGSQYDTYLGDFVDENAVAFVPTPFEQQGNHPNPFAPLQTAASGGRFGGFDMNRNQLPGNRYRSAARGGRFNPIQNGDGTPEEGWTIPFPEDIDLGSLPFLGDQYIPNPIDGVKAAGRAARAGAGAVASGAGAVAQAHRDAAMAGANAIRTGAGAARDALGRIPLPDGIPFGYWTWGDDERQHFHRQNPDIPVPSGPPAGGDIAPPNGPGQQPVPPGFSPPTPQGPPNLPGPSWYPPFTGPQRTAPPENFMGSGSPKPQYQIDEEGRPDPFSLDFGAMNKPTFRPPPGYVDRPGSTPWKPNDPNSSVAQERYDMIYPQPYEVREGDTLSDIAAQNGISVEEIWAANRHIKDIDKIDAPPARTLLRIPGQDNSQDTVRFGQDEGDGIQSLGSDGYRFSQYERGVRPTDLEGQLKSAQERQRQAYDDWRGRENPVTGSGDIQPPVEPGMWPNPPGMYPRYGPVERMDFVNRSGGKPYVRPDDVPIVYAEREPIDPNFYVPRNPNLPNMRDWRDWSAREDGGFAQEPVIVGEDGAELAVPLNDGGLMVLNQDQLGFNPEMLNHSRVSAARSGGRYPVKNAQNGGVFPVTRDMTGSDFAIPGFSKPTFSQEGIRAESDRLTPPRARQVTRQSGSGYRPAPMVPFGSSKGSSASGFASPTPGYLSGLTANEREFLRSNLATRNINLADVEQNASRLFGSTGGRSGRRAF